MPRTRKAYPPEFRQRMVELARAGRTPEQLAKEFEPSANTIRKWGQQADRDQGRRNDGLTTPEREELRRLRRELRQVKLEREILGKSNGLVRSGGRLDPVRGFEFVSDHQELYPVRVMCRVLGVSPSGYYAWRKREASVRSKANAELLEKIEEIHATSDETYGAPRVHAELEAQGHGASLNRVARVMRGAGIQGVSRRKGTRTTQRDADARPAPDLVDRQFVATGPDQLWVADITYIPTWEGFLYLAVVLDVWSRRIVGWAMASHLRTELVLGALDMALRQRRPEGVIHHSDQGSQYTSLAFGRRCKEAGVRPSMGSVGDAYDNAMAEAFFATLECELLDRRCFRTRAEARMAVFRYIEGWYNPRRRHSALGYDSPVDYERKHALAVQGSQAKRSEPAAGVLLPCASGTAEALLTLG
ncbi:MAG: IS3 family transposase [Candidatus Bipolaricaulota bacterium]